MTIRKEPVARNDGAGEDQIARFEVRGLRRDKGLVRTLAKRLARNDEAAGRLRVRIANDLALPHAWPRTGKDIYDALRGSAAVAADLDFEREEIHLPDVDL